MTPNFTPKLPDNVEVVNTAQYSMYVLKKDGKHMRFWIPDINTDSEAQLQIDLALKYGTWENEG